jgi:DNA-binding MurR/RpiR family transcriptional regulator
MAPTPSPSPTASYRRWRAQRDYAFEVATEGVAHSLSVTAMMTLINALVAGVSLKDPQRTSQALQRVDQQFLSRNLLVT